MRVKDYNYELVLEYIETRNDKLLTQDVIDYLSMLEMIRSMYFRYESKVSIITFLKNPPYSLTAYEAERRFVEMMNLFYSSDNGVSKEAWRNAYAEKLDKMAELLLATYRSPADGEGYIKAINAAAKMRQLDQIEPPKLPSALWDKPNKIYVIDPALIGRKKANRNVLAQQIDSYDIPAADKARLRQESMIDEIEFIENGEEESN